MIIDQGPQTCAHKGCACEVPAGQTCCGPHCANASIEAEESSTSCGCGHEQCNGGRATSASQADIEHV